MSIGTYSVAHIDSFLCKLLESPFILLIWYSCDYFQLCGNKKVCLKVMRTYLYGFFVRKYVSICSRLVI